MRFALTVALAACLTLAACQEDEAVPAGVPDPDRAVAAETACAKDGGAWKTRAGVLSYCERATPDAGARCSSGADCAGLCLARSRSCAPVTPLYGCNEILDSAGRTMTNCLE